MLPKFVICGVEHSGTTLLSEIFRQVDGLDAGFEVGVLLTDNPREFRNYHPFIDQMPEGWGLTEEDLDYICDTDSFETFYERLYERSKVIKKPCEIFDKTPRYAWALDTVMEKYNGKFICTYKDPRALVWSNYKRYAKQNEDFIRWVEDNLPTFKRYWLKIYNNYQKFKNNNNVRLISLEDLTLNTKNVLKDLFDFIEVHFKLDYLFLSKPRYSHVRADYISIKIAFEYRYNLKKEEMKIIEEYFRDLAEWFYE